MSTTKSLGQSFVAGDIDGDVITANTLPPAKISNSANLFSIGGTGVARGNAIATISGPLTIGTLNVSTSLDYVFNLGTTPINLNRSSGALGATLGGVNISGSAAQLNNTTSLIGTTWGAQGGVIYNNNGILAGIGTGTSGQFLRSAGTSAPTWASLTTAAGQIVIGGAGGSTSTLAIGSANQILRVNSGATAPEWFTPTYMTNPMTTAGDIIYGGTSGAPTRLAAGSNGQFLQYSTTSNAPQWVTFSSLANPMNAAGQMIYGGTSGTPAAVAAGTSGQVLKSGGTGAPTWSSSLFTLGSTAITAGGTFTSIAGGLTLGGGPTLQSGTGGMTFTISQTGAGTRVDVDANGIVRRNTSSIRYKKNISEYYPNEEKIFNLRPVAFHYNSQNDNEIKRVGYIAEEVDEIGLKEYINYNLDNSPESIDYSSMVIATIQLIKNQKVEIDDLKNKIGGLEARLDAAGL